MDNVLSIVSYRILPPKFGGQKGIALFNEYLSRHQNLTCFTIKDNNPKGAPYEVINQMGVGRFRYVNPFYFFKIRRIVRNKKVTCLILEHPYLGWLAMMLKSLCGLKLVIHSHNIESERFRSTGKWWWKLLWRYERWVHKNADLTFCISEQDRQYFISRYGVPKANTSVITYGISWNSCPAALERMVARKELMKVHRLGIDTTLFLFNGALDYWPNLQAVRDIVEQINPIFKKAGLDYRILICGKNLPMEIKFLLEREETCIYAGFVEDIDIYFKGADVFINPITDGGGIKTKLVEALGSNLNCVSTINGAIGVDPALCNGKLLLSEVGSWADFAKKMEESALIRSSIGQPFFDHFYWDNIAKKAACLIEDIITSEPRG